MRSLWLALGMLVPAMAAAQTLTLQLQAPYSAVYSFTSSSESVQDIGGMGATTVNTSVESQLRLESAQNARDTLTVTWHMEGTKVSVRIPTVGMDTAMQLAPIAARLTLLRNGTVVHQQWLDTSGLAGGEMFGQGGILGVRGTSHPWKIEFPAKPITVGESWEIAHTDTLDPSGKGSSVRSAKATYRLEALVDTLGTRCARIRSTTQFEFSVQQQIQYGTVYGTVSVQGTGTARGVAYVEVKSGFLVARQEDSETQMEMAFSGQIETVGSMQQSLQYRLVRLQ
jgi:hypothetical protein